MACDLPAPDRPGDDDEAPSRVSRRRRPAAVILRLRRAASIARCCSASRAVELARGMIAAGLEQLVAGGDLHQRRDAAPRGNGHADQRHAHRQQLVPLVVEAQPLVLAR